MLCSQKTSHPVPFFSFLTTKHLSPHLIFSFFLTSAFVSPPANHFLFAIAVFLPGGHSVSVACCTPADWPQPFHVLSLWTPDTLNNEWVWDLAETKTKHLNLTVNAIGLKIHYSQSCWRQERPLLKMFLLILFVSCICLLAETVCFKS